jgi:hypothetical protein
MLIKVKKNELFPDGWCAGPQMGRERDLRGGLRGGGRVWSGAVVEFYVPSLSLAVNPFGHTHICTHTHTRAHTHTHTHTHCTDCEGNVIGGHLLYANVFTTAEILLGVLPHNALSRYTSSSQSSSSRNSNNCNKDNSIVVLKIVVVVIIIIGKINTPRYLIGDLVTLHNPKPFLSSCSGPLISGRDFLNLFFVLLQVF